MKKIRVLLANRSRMMQEVVDGMIQSLPDVEVVGGMVNPVDLLIAVRETNADALILDLENSEEPGVISHLIAEYPELTIVALAKNGKKAFVRPPRQEILFPTRTKIVAAIRHAIESRFSSKE